jgi:hypothetical protein
VTGIQDTNLWLRDTLRNYMNSVDFSGPLKSRWFADRRAFFSAEAAVIKMDDDEVERTLEKVFFLLNTILILPLVWFRAKQLTRLCWI